MKTKLTKTERKAIDRNIKIRKEFREWWCKTVKVLASYNSPEHEAIAWASWEAAKKAK